MANQILTQTTVLFNAPAQQSPQQITTKIMAHLCQLGDLELAPDRLRGIALVKELGASYA